MHKRHRQHLKSRKSKPFNTASKDQEDAAKVASNLVWTELTNKYTKYDFDNLQSLGLKDLDASYAVCYLNRGLRRLKAQERKLHELQGLDSANGIRPDGGIFFVKSKLDGFHHIIGALEVKHQGEYDGYTPISDSDWKKKGGDPNISRKDRPAQAQGNAIERFAKNANAIKTLTSFYDYNPYLVICEGFDFFLKEDYKIFESQAHAKRFEGRDSSILMRLVAGNDWLPLNKIYVTGFPHGKTRSHPATIYARMPKFSAGEIARIMLEVIDRTLAHLESIGEI